MQDNKTQRLAWLIWGLGALLFLCEYFARISPSIMEKDLMQAFHVKAFMLGNLSAAFYYPYILMQLPVGMLIDKFGPRRLLTITGFFCMVSCFLFAEAKIIEMAILARVLLGFSAAFAFVGALKLATNWFPARRIGLLAGLTQAAGMLGAAIGDAPMSMLKQALGWRPTMLLIASLFAVIALFIMLIVRDKPKLAVNKSAVENIKTKVNQGDMLSGLRQVLANPQSWLNATYAGCVYATTAAFGELWGPAFLHAAYGLDDTQAANGIGLIFIGWCVGGPIIGWLSDRLGKRRPILFLSAATGMLLISVVIYGSSILNTTWLYVVLFAFGISNTGVATSYAVSTEINPLPIAGTSLAFANMASVLIGALCQPVIGFVLDKTWNGTLLNGSPVYSAHNFHYALMIFPVFLALGILLPCFIKETYGKHS